MNDSADRDSDLLDLLVAWDERADSDNADALDDLCRAHPELAGDLRRYADRIARIAPLLALEASDDAHALPPLPGFELLDEVGRGGMGVVYKARDLALDRVVAVKVPHAHRGVPIVRKRFEREARTLAQLRHANIVSVHAAGLAAEGPYFVMEYVPGGSLAEHMGRLAATPERAAALLEQVARGVDHAHAAGVIHRDLKPSNVLLGDDGRPLVGDFGVAALLAGETLTPAGDDTPGDASRITRTGVAAGTPIYAAPETFRDSPARLTPAADIWSLGVMLYELLTGQLPFDGTGDELRANIAAAAPPRPRAVRSGVPRGLEAIALRCLAKAPGGRFPSAGALADALAQWRRGYVARQKTRRVGLPAASALAAALALAVVLWPPGPEARHAAASRAVQARLQRDEPVTLIGATRAPQSYRVRFGAGYTTTSLNAGTFTVAAGRPALVELLTDPGIDRFRLSAEIREDGYWGDAYLGLYYAHQVVRTSGEDGHVFGCMRFADRGPQARHTVGADGVSRGTVGFDQVCLTAPAIIGEDWVSHSSANRPYVTPPTHVTGLGPWRTIVIDVDPTVVRGTFDGQPVGDVVQSRVATWAGVLPRLQPKLRGRPVVSSRGGVGIYVHGCEASIRNCRIGPLPTP